MEIRPLLLYYGMTAYAKAVVVGRNLRALATLSQSHGLHDVSAHDARLAELRVKVQGDGLFHALNDTVRNSEGIRYFEGSMHCRHSIPTARSADLNDMTLSLKDILARTIRLETLYQDTFGEKAKTHGFDLYVRNGPADDQHTASAAGSPRRTVRGPWVAHRREGCRFAGGCGGEL